MKTKKTVLQRKLGKKKEPEIKISEPPKPLEPQKEMSLREKLDNLDKKFDELGGKKEVDGKFKKKSFKIPFKVRSKLKKGLMMNKVQVIFLSMNTALITAIGEFRLGQLVVDTPYGIKTWDAEDDIIWQWNGKVPTVIVPEWDLRPLTRGRLIKKSVEERSLSAPGEVIIRKYEATQALAQEKKKMNPKTAILIFVVAAAAAWIMFGGGQ